MEMTEKPFDKVRRKMVTARIEFMGQLAKFNKEQLSKPPVEGEWSALEVAHHLYIGDGLLLEALLKVQDEDNPLIAEIEKDGPELTRTTEPPASLDAVLAGMAARREEIFEYLKSLPDEAWERPLRHPTRGDLKFYQLANMLALHDQIHAKQLVDIKDALAPAHS